MNRWSGLDSSGWLLYHSAGIFPGQEEAVQEVLKRFVSDWCRPDLMRWDHALHAKHEVLERWARLIGAASDTVFGAENVTEAFAKFVCALDRAVLSGRRVLIAADCFPSLHYLLSGLAPVIGFTLDTVPVDPALGYVTEDAFLSSWKDDVALAVITWATSTTSKLADLPRLVAHGRANGSLIAVDITQGIGVLEFDVMQTDVDFAAGSTLKWLCGAPGAGLAYIKRDLFDSKLIPMVTGWFSQSDPFNWDLSRFALAPDAGRFNSGTPSVLPFIASGPGLEWHLSPAAANVRSHNLALSNRLIALSDKKGYRLRSPREDHRRGGSVMVELPEHIDPRRLETALATQGILVDTRGRIMRMSPGVVTTDAAIDRLDELLPVA